MKLDEIKALLDTVEIQKGTSGISSVSKPDALLQVRAALILRYGNILNDPAMKSLLDEIEPEVTIKNLHIIRGLVNAMTAAGRT